MLQHFLNPDLHIPKSESKGQPVKQITPNTNTPRIKKETEYYIRTK